MATKKRKYTKRMSWPGKPPLGVFIRSLPRGTKPKAALAQAVAAGYTGAKMSAVYQARSQRNRPGKSSMKKRVKWKTTTSIPAAVAAQARVGLGEDDVRFIRLCLTLGPRRVSQLFERTKRAFAVLGVQY